MKSYLFILSFCLLAPTSPAQTLRIATYNVNWSNRHGDQILDAIHQAQPDVICFQETSVQAEDFLRRTLEDTYPHFHSTGHDGRFGAERLAFASKNKLTEVSFTPPDAGLFGFYSAVLQLEDETVQLVNVHLTPFQIKRGASFKEAMDALAATETKHVSEIAAVLKTIDPARPTIIAGDFNSVSTHLAPQRLHELGYTDAFASVHENADAHPTWYWPTRPLPLALRIDYIFHSPHFSTIESRVIRREGSDHSLVIAKLKRAEPPQ